MHKTLTVRWGFYALLSHSVAGKTAPAGFLLSVFG